MTTKPASRQLACKFQPCAGGVARADDRDHRPHQAVWRTAHAEQRRRIVERRQPRWIAGFAGRDQRDADPFGRSDLSPRFLLAADPLGTRRAATPHQIGQPLQRCARIAEVVDERVKGARPDIVAADQPQGVDPVGVGEVGRELCSVMHAACSFAQPEIAINLFDCDGRYACSMPRPSVTCLVTTGKPA
jgi:hypothetical protein